MRESKARARIDVRVDSETKEALDAYCEVYGVTQAKAVRGMLEHELLREPLPKKRVFADEQRAEYVEQMDRVQTLLTEQYIEMRQIGNNINQIAYKLNATGKLSGNNVKVMNAWIGELRKLNEYNEKIQQGADKAWQHLM